MATLYELLGGQEAIDRIVRHFYDVMDVAPEARNVRASHPPDLEASREKLRLFLTGWTGGPQLYVERFGHPRLRMRHLPFSIGVVERDEWLWCMDQALDREEIDPEIREFLGERMRAMADHMRNRIEPPPEG
jgi:hemoglobin